MNASDPHFADVLRRAQEIQSGPSEADVDAFIRAAEEIGISREAVTAALRERLEQARSAFAEGEWTFAKSSDGRHYVARVESISDGTARIRFASGASQTCRLEELLPFDMSPGTVMQYWYCGWWYPCEVVSLNASQSKATVRCWGIEYTVPFHHLRKSMHPTDQRRATLTAWAVVAGVALTSGALGALATWLCTR